MSLGYCVVDIDCLGDWGHCICSKHDPGLVGFGFGFSVALSHFDTEG